MNAWNILWGVIEDLPLSPLSQCSKWIPLNTLSIDGKNKQYTPITTMTLTHLQVKASLSRNLRGNWEISYLMLVLSPYQLICVLSPNLAVGLTVVQLTSTEKVEWNRISLILMSCNKLGKSFNLLHMVVRNHKHMQNPPSQFWSTREIKRTCLRIEISNK